MCLREVEAIMTLLEPNTDSVWEAMIILLGEAVIATLIYFVVLFLIRHPLLSHFTSTIRIPWHR